MFYDELIHLLRRIWVGAFIVRVGGWEFALMRIGVSIIVNGIGEVQNK